MLSWGPCQFATLGFIVDRQWKIDAFVPESFWGIGETFPVHFCVFSRLGPANQIKSIHVHSSLHLTRRFESPDCIPRRNCDISRSWQTSDSRYWQTSDCDPPTSDGGSDVDQRPGHRQRPLAVDKPQGRFENDQIKQGQVLSPNSHALTPEPKPRPEGQGRDGGQRGLQLAAVQAV